MSRVGVLLTILVLAITACGGIRSLTIDNDGDWVPLSPGEKIEITLGGNATTGFIWELVEYDPAVITPLGDPSYEEDGGDAVGTGGTWTWTLRAVADGESPVRFVYHRSWEDQDPASIFSLTVAVGR
jgi:inhibitor of cysteine peptidase